MNRGTTCAPFLFILFLQLSPLKLTVKLLKNKQFKFRKFKKDEIMMKKRAQGNPYVAEN